MLEGPLPEPAKAKQACVLCRRKKIKCIRAPGEAHCQNCKKRSIMCHFESPGIDKSWRWQKGATGGRMFAAFDTKAFVVTPSISPPPRGDESGTLLQAEFSSGVQTIDNDAANEMLDFDPMELLWDVEGFERQLEENIGRTFNLDFPDMDIGLGISPVMGYGDPVEVTPRSQETPQLDPPEGGATTGWTPGAGVGYGKRLSISSACPQGQTTDGMFDLFFANNTYLSDMINQDRFKNNFGRGIPLAVALGNAIMAQTYLYLSMPKRATALYAKAKRQIGEYLDEGKDMTNTFYSVTAIQLLLVLCDYELKVGKWAISGLTFARALMLTRMRGLYVYDVDHPFSLNKKLDDDFQTASLESAGFPGWLVREETRRTFFKVYCYDKYLTLYKGVYESIPHARVSVQLPLEGALAPSLAEPSSGKRRPFISDVLPRIKDGERLSEIGPASVHIIFISLVSCANMWLRSICMADTNPDEITLKAYLDKMNEIILQMECIQTNYPEEFELYNRLGDLVREIMKLKLYHGIIFVVGRLLEKSSKEFTNVIDDIYLDIKGKCLTQTVSLIAVFDKLDLGKLVSYNPFFSLALHCSIKSAIQLFVICKQPNCTHISGTSVTQLFNEISNVITQLEKLDKRPPLLTSLILFYNTKLESYDKDPFANIFFEDTLLFP